MCAYPPTHTHASRAYTIYIQSYRVLSQKNQQQQKPRSLSWHFTYSSAIPATWEAEAGTAHSQVLPGVEGVSLGLAWAAK